MTHHVGDPGKVEFEMVVPDLPETAWLCVMSSPLDSQALLHEPAREIARFPLRSGGGQEKSG
jgi:hypothetical protein